MSRQIKARARTQRDVRAIHQTRKEAAQARRAAAAAGIGLLPAVTATPSRFTLAKETQTA